MANYQLLIQRIITLLLLIIQDMVGSTSLRGDIVVDTNLTLNGSPYVVSQDLVVAVNATLTVQPGVQLHFDAGVGLRVKGSLHAEGNSRERIGFTRIPIKSSANMDNTTIYNNGIRLRDGNSYRDGRLEIFLKGLYGEWGTVCRHNWDMRDAEVN